MQSLIPVLERDPRIAYGLLFGSTVRGEAHPSSDLDIAVGLYPGAAPATGELGRLVSDLEQATGRTVDLVVIDDAPPALAYRIFREGQPLVMRDRRIFSQAKTRAILVYLDFRPVEDLMVRGALAAAARG